MQPGGFLVVCADDAGAVRLAEYGRSSGHDVRTYGESAAADLRSTDLCSRPPGQPPKSCTTAAGSGVMDLRLPGRHNALNAAAGTVCRAWPRAPVGGLRDGLAGFTGTRRRFEPKGTGRGVRVFDDYAHHPTEIAATLTAARHVVGDGGWSSPSSRTATRGPRRSSGVRAGPRPGGRSRRARGLSGGREDPVPGASGASVAAAVPLPPERVSFEPSWSAVAADWSSAPAPATSC